MNRTISSILFICTFVLSTACDTGSGGGIGGSGVEDPPIITTGVSTGSISGLGSIVLNGQRFDTDNALIFVNDVSATEVDLRIGMRVLAEVEFTTLVATQVDYIPTLVGPIESVNVVDRSFVSLHQNIRTNSNTLFEGISITEIVAGNIVEVSGFRDATGVIVASFVRPALNPSLFQLSGAIVSEISNDLVFRLNGLPVDIAQANLLSVSVETLNFGDKISVTANSSNYNESQPLLVADTLRRAVEPTLNTGIPIEYEGIVSTFVSPFEFDVYWQPVVTNDQTRVEFQDGTVGNLSMIMRNSRLEVEGTVNNEGAIVATKIILIANENSEIVGTVGQINLNGSSFTVLGLEIQINDDTDFDASSNSLSTLREGDYVEIDASLVGDRLIANSIEVDDFDERAFIKGPVTFVDAVSERIEILHRPITPGENTEYENSDDVDISKQDFFNQVKVGDIVRARWDQFQSADLPPDDLDID